MQRIKGYHAHIYFDASTIEQARTLCEDAAKLFHCVWDVCTKNP